MVVATFNGSAHVLQQLRSIVDQTVHAAEVIVTDDGSMDDTIEVVRAFAEEVSTPVRLHQNATRLGYVENFLHGARLATGDLIAFADQDDVWLPDKVRRCVAAFAAPSTMAVVHSSRVVDDALRPEGGLHTGLLRAYLHGDELFVPHGSHLVFRASLLQLVDPERRPISVYGHGPQEHDEWAAYAARSCGRLVYLRDRLMLYRRHGAAASFEQGTGRLGSLGSAGATRGALAVQAAQARGVHLRGLAADAAPPLAATLSAAAARNERLAANLASREERIHAGTRARRVRALGGSAVAGDYGSRARGGLGALTLVRDAVAAIS